MKLTQFTLYKNTLFTDMQNTVHFNSNDERDNFSIVNLQGRTSKRFKPHLILGEIWER